MSWNQFLSSLAGPGVNSAVGVILSFLADYWPWYNGLDAKLKRLIFAGLCFALPLAATVAGLLTGEFGAWGDWAGTWWPALVAGAVAAFGGTLAHTRSLR